MAQLKKVVALIVSDHSGFTNENLHKTGALMFTNETETMTKLLFISYHVFLNSMKRTIFTLTTGCGGQDDLGVDER